MIGYKINIENVVKFDIDCFSWSYMYIDILKSFDIKADVKKDYFKHFYVKIDLKNGNEIIADQYILLLDLIAIKMGMPTKNFMHYVIKKK